MMDLATFGAILTFALELEQRAQEFYKAGARDRLEEAFAALSQGSKKRADRIERTRREGVAEMILEPITGLHSEDYQVRLDAQAEAGERLEQALGLETVCAHFYRDSSEKMPVREVARTFQRMAKENQIRVRELEAVEL
jgi:hypothetical protein